MLSISPTRDAGPALRACSFHRRLAEFEHVLPRRRHLPHFLREREFIELKGLQTPFAAVVRSKLRNHALIYMINGLRGPRRRFKILWKKPCTLPTLPLEQREEIKQFIYDAVLYKIRRPETRKIVIAVRRHGEDDGEQVKEGLRYAITEAGYRGVRFPSTMEVWLVGEEKGEEERMVEEVCESCAIVGTSRSLGCLSGGEAWARDWEEDGV